MNETISKTTIVDHITKHIAANESSHGVINSTPIAGARSHFRSRTFTSFIGCNPLMSAAAVVLAFNEQLKTLESHENLEQLHQDLVHEIQVLESNAQERGFSTETILIARYVLCATLDETIIYSPLKNSSLWQHYKLIGTFQNEHSADQRFFLIINRLLSAPATHIDLLELIYTCLSLGYEGKYRYEAKGHLALIELKDNLFQAIRAVRNDPPKLSTVMTPAQQKSSSPRVSFWPTLVKSTLAVVFILGVIYGSFAFVFHKISAPVKTLISSFVLTRH